ncbi:MAG: DMT family transporter [Candidatus Dependentiae bacterium]
MLLIIVLYALFGSSFVLGKLLLSYTTPLFLTGARMTIGGLILLSYLFFYAHEHFKFKRKHIYWYVQMIFFGIYITYSLRFWALNYMPAAKTNFIYNLSPFLSALFSYIVFSEKLSMKKWLGLAVGLVGLLPVLLSTSNLEQQVGEMSFLSWPELAVILSVATHTYSWIIMRKLVKEKSYSPMMINGLSMTCGGILALITSLFVDGFAPIASGSIGYFFGILGMIILLSNIICYNLYGWLLKRYTATFLSFSGFLSPIFTALYGWILLGEVVTWHFYASCIIVFIGLYLFYQEELQESTALHIGEVDLD